MAVMTRSLVTETVSSHAAGMEIAHGISDAFGGEDLKLLLLYATMNHSQQDLLRGVQARLGPNVAIVGCSSQGIMSRGRLSEEGYLAGAMGVGGSSLTVSAGCVERIYADPQASGAALGQSLKNPPPQVAILLYDPLCGTDMNLFLAGMHAELGCPIVGGGAGHRWGPWQRTNQYFDQQVLSRAAVGIALSGDFRFEIGSCHGTSPVGIEMTVTRAEGNILLELDGRPALQVCEELSGGRIRIHTSSLSIGLRPNGVESSTAKEPYLVRAYFGEDTERSGIVLQAGLPEGTRIMMHHRTIEGVLEGTVCMAQDLAQRVQGRTVHAVLGFECGARTSPFLGRERALEENLLLQQTLAPQAEWLGTLAWGEVFPMGSGPVFSNYTYPLLLLTD